MDMNTVYLMVGQFVLFSIAAGFLLLMLAILTNILTELNLVRFRRGDRLGIPEYDLALFGFGVCVRPRCALKKEYQTREGFKKDFPYTLWFETVSEEGKPGYDRIVFVGFGLVN